MSAASKTPATAETLLALGEQRYEVIAGELLPKAEASGEHSDAQLGLGSRIRSSYHRGPGGPGGPGGWWIYTEAQVELATHDIVRPDLAGWRRDRVPDRPVGTPIRVKPDWICEIVSPSNARRDRVEKIELYRRHGIPHYWIVDPIECSLVVHRLTADGYLLLLVAGRDDVVRAEPFEAIELRVGTLFGDE